ncbi:hypothetical protein B1757_07305 [Acidithiobacillus marinus]|uniref:Porin n=1 Tax=Acidithiobacillus marinus TaxID=187490 RepID=A0A2I1DLK7_9PROT|nr:outer membrane beta-barrel protein [Acidithiobacillus marinus]PKY10762.1 hypothetical protein B1757_07305 [Acidithiobacillus marinus]
MRTAKSSSRFKPVILAMLAASPLGIDSAEADPLALPSPLTFKAGPLGTLNVQGVASGYGVWQSNKFPASSFPGSKSASADISNGMVMISKNSGLIQFAVQAGAYNVMTLGSNYASTSAYTQGTFGALPMGYIEIAPDDHFNIQIGKLYTLIGAEYTFSYQNWNIARGLLWSQENAINKGVQINYNKGPVTAAISWNDGFYSNRFNWISGMLTWAIDKHNTLFAQGDGNLGHSNFVNANIATTPLQDNESAGVIGYTYTSAKLVVTPYLQYTSVPGSAIQSLGAGTKTTSTLGGAILANYSLTDKISLAGRVEYISNSGTATDGSANLTGFGAGSHAWSLTATPTYQDGGFFARAELSYVKASMANGSGFAGPDGLAKNQVRGMVEAGFMF